MVLLNPGHHTWELQACLTDYGKEGHISNEGEDLLKRLWDLLSELSLKNSVDSANKLLRATNPLPQEFDRRGAVSADQLCSVWQQQESMHSVPHTALNKSKDVVISGNPPLLY